MLGTISPRRGGALPAVLALQTPFLSQGEGIFCGGIGVFCILSSFYSSPSLVGPAPVPEPFPVPHPQLPQFPVLLASGLLCCGESSGSFTNISALKQKRPKCRPTDE